MAMKAYDVLGNELRAGDVVFFQKLGSLVTITEVEEPGIVDKAKPGHVTFQVVTPFVLDQGMKDVRFGDFMKVHTPDESAKVDKQIDDIMSGKNKKRPLQMSTRG